MKTSSIAYKLMWRGSESFGSLVPQDRLEAARSKSKSTSSNQMDEEEDEVSNQNEDESSSSSSLPAPLSESEDEDADVDLVKTAMEKTKVRRGAPKFDATVLCGKSGLVTLHEEMAKVKFKGAGYESADLHLLVRKYKEWMFAMFPSMPFEPLMDKIQDLSGNKILHVRSFHRIRLMIAVYDLVEFFAPVLLSNQHFVERMQEQSSRGLNITGVLHRESDDHEDFFGEAPQPDQPQQPMDDEMAAPAEEADEEMLYELERQNAAEDEDYVDAKSKKKQQSSARSNDEDDDLYLGLGGDDDEDDPISAAPLRSSSSPQSSKPPAASQPKPSQSSSSSSHAPALSQPASAAHKPASASTSSSAAAATNHSSAAAPKPAAAGGLVNPFLNKSMGSFKPPKAFLPIRPPSE